MSFVLGFSSISSAMQPRTYSLKDLDMDDVIEPLELHSEAQYEFLRLSQEQERTLPADTFAIPFHPIINRITPPMVIRPAMLTRIDIASTLIVKVREVSWGVFLAYFNRAKDIVKGNSENKLFVSMSYQCDHGTAHFFVPYDPNISALFEGKEVKLNCIQIVPTHRSHQLTFKLDLPEDEWNPNKQSVSHPSQMADSSIFEEVPNDLDWVSTIF